MFGSVYQVLNIIIMFSFFVKPTNQNYKHKIRTQTKNNRDFNMVNTGKNNATFCWDSSCAHPGNLAWSAEMMLWKRRFSLQLLGIFVFFGVLIFLFVSIFQADLVGKTKSL